MASAVAVDWCGTGQPAAVDRKPEADYSSFRHVHVTYVIPADAPSRLEELASKIVTDLASADAWWQREDPSRTIRFDRFAFPGCSSKLGSLDLGFLRLARPAAAYEGDQGIVGMVPELTDLAELDFHKNLVYYDGPSLYGPTVCGTTLVPRNDPVRGGLGGLAFIWLRSLCGQDVGTGNLNAEVVTHELIHGQGFVGTGGSPNECPEPNRGHTCDSELDILHPEATLETTLAERRLDVNRDDYYGIGAGDLRDSPYLTRLPQQRLALGVSGARQGSRNDPHDVPCRLRLQGHVRSRARPRARRHARRGAVSRVPLPRLVGCVQGKRGSVLRHSPRQPNGNRALRAGHVPPLRHRCRTRPRIECARRVGVRRTLLGGVRGRLKHLAPCDAPRRAQVRRMGGKLPGKGSLHHPDRPRSVCSRDIR